jgi:hypothetical protein
VRWKEARYDKSSMGREGRIYQAWGGKVGKIKQAREGRMTQASKREGRMNQASKGGKDESSKQGREG